MSENRLSQGDVAPDFALPSDDGAVFDVEHTIRVDEISPQITWGTDPSQVIGISGRVPRRYPSIEEAFHQAIAAVDPRAAVTAELASFRLEGPVTLLAIGKAAPGDKTMVDALTPAVAAAVHVALGAVLVRGELPERQRRPLPRDRSLRTRWPSSRRRTH